MHKLTDRVTQFRALGRFVWPFWWALVLSFTWYVARWRHLPHLRWALVVLCVLLVIDTLNATHHYRSQTQVTNLLTWPAAAEPVRQLVGWPQAGRYQALLPLPCYHVGTKAAEGSLNLTIDPDDPHCNTT